MKIKFDIDDKFKEPEIHICCNRISEDSQDIYRMLESVLSETITVFKKFETRSIPLHEIVRIYSENKKVFLRTSKETFEVKERLYVLEERLQDRNFIRISNTEIVSISQIEKLDMSYVGTIKMFFKNNDSTFVSRRYIGKIKEALLEG